MVQPIQSSKLEPFGRDVDAKRRFAETGLRGSGRRGPRNVKGGSIRSTGRGLRRYAGLMPRRWNELVPVPHKPEVAKPEMLVRAVASAQQRSAAANRMADQQEPRRHLDPNAVGLLMTNSNLVGCSTGRSAGFSPLRMRPA